VPFLHFKESIMRITGRILRPSNLAERRLLKSLGFDFIRVSRAFNPYAVARLVKRVTAGGADVQKLKAIATKKPGPGFGPISPPPPPPPLPDSTCEPREGDRAA
jgi:hypothetical protein